MAFHVKTLGDQEWLLILQDQKSVREKPHTHTHKKKSRGGWIIYAGEETPRSEHSSMQRASDDGLMWVRSAASDS